MREFDYVQAWCLLAMPEYESLPADVRALALHVAEVADGLRQERNLLMPWPEGLRQRFDNVPAETLAKAARAVYFLGHWKPGNATLPDALALSHGGSWKFANYADQALAARLGLSFETPWGKDGVSIYVHEGAIRVGWSHKHGWTWHEVAFATEGNLKRLLGLVAELGESLEYRGNGKDRMRAEDAWSAFIERVKAAFAEDEFSRWKTDKFMREAPARNW